MNKLEKVFEIIGFEWLGVQPLKEEWAIEYYELKGKQMVKIHYDNKKGASCASIYFSLADLLANKSFCKVLWGVDRWECGKEDCTHWPDYYHRVLGFESLSIEAFQILRDKGPDQALDYMIKTAKR